MAWHQIGQNRASQWDPPEDPATKKATRATFRYWDQRDRAKWLAPIPVALAAGHWLPTEPLFITLGVISAIVIGCVFDAVRCYRISKKFNEDAQRNYRVIDPNEPQPSLEEGEIGL